MCIDLPYLYVYLIFTLVLPDGVMRTSDQSVHVPLSRSLNVYSFTYLLIRSLLSQERVTLVFKSVSPCPSLKVFIIMCIQYLPTYSVFTLVLSRAVMRISNRQSPVPLLKVHYNHTFHLLPTYLVFTLVLSRASDAYIKSVSPCPSLKVLNRVEPSAAGRCCSLFVSVGLQLLQEHKQPALFPQSRRRPQELCGEGSIAPTVLFVLRVVCENILC